MFNKLFSSLSSFFGSERALNFVTRSSDLFLAFLLIAIISMMVIPVPPWVIDVVISMNLSIAMLLLMVALYIPTAVHLSMFPSLLLITTLFRLGINISSTRLILLHAYAGDIILAFGNFVVQGNYVVGAVIFLIITIVQFIVVTKGAERVAEVAARFRLDAMPGKQMSIDADMRAGLIDANQARQRRMEIQRESEMYGAMDGAMKFVKGDVIAGIVITLINVIGGLIIGIFIHNMSASQSAKVYSLLSIGDGLVSQIPALLIAITAGIVTTRVSSDRRDANLGLEIAGQVFRQPKALLIAACFIFMMAWVPGFRKVPFLVLSTGIAAIGIGMWQTSKKGGAGARANAAAKGGASTLETEVEGHSAVTGGGVDEYALTLPVILEVGAQLSTTIKTGKAGSLFIDMMIPKMRQALYQDMGIRYPGVHVRTDSPVLDADEYTIHLNEVPIVRGKIIPGHLLTNEIEKNLKRYNLPYKTYKNSLGLPALWVEETYREILDKSGIKYWDSLEVVILHLSYFFRHYANEFLGIQEVRAMMEFLEKSFPDLVKEVTRLIPLQRLTEIFRRLVQEQVSIRDLRTIMEALSEWAQTEKDTVLLTEYIRSSLKRYISYKYSQGQTVLSVYLLDPEIEDLVRGAIKQTSAGSYLALDPDTVQMVLQAMRNTITPTPPGASPPVMLTAIDVRRFVRKLIEMEFPDLPVVSYQEIVSEIRIQPLARIQLT